MNWEEIRKEYETSKVTLKALAEKHGVKLGTLKSRKSREKWLRGATGKDATKSEKDATLKKQDANNRTRLIKESLPSDELTDKQRFFCIHYVKTFNATQSAIKAGYAPESAHVRGHELVRNSKVGAYIRELKSQMTDTLFLDAMDVLRKYAEIAFSDITDYLKFGKKEEPVMTMFGELKDEDGNVIKKEVNYVDFNESSQVDGTIITEAKQGKDGVSIKLADKMKALDKLDKYFELLPENYKRKVEEGKLEIQREKLALDKAKSNIDDGDYEDDGFIEALGDAVEVWNDDSDDGSTEET